MYSSTGMMISERSGCSGSSYSTKVLFLLPLREVARELGAEGVVFPFDPARCGLRTGFEAEDDVLRNEDFLSEAGAEFVEDRRDVDLEDR